MYGDSVGAIPSDKVYIKLDKKICLHWMSIFLILE